MPVDSSSPVDFNRILPLLATLPPLAGQIMLRQAARRLYREDLLHFTEFKSRLFNPERVLRQLDGREARQLWSRLPLEDRAHLISRFTAETVKAYDLTGTQITAIPPPCSDPVLRKSGERFRQTLEHLLLDGLVVGAELWERALLFPPCYGLEIGGIQQVRLIFQEQAIARGESLRLLIYRESYGAESCHLRIVRQGGAGRRPLGQARLHFAGDGFAQWVSAPLQEAGLHEIFVESSQPERHLLARGVVAVTVPRDEPLGLLLHDLAWRGEEEDKIVRLDGGLLTGWGSVRSDVEIHGRFYCACGHRLDENLISFRQGRGVFDLHSDGHQGPFFLAFGMVGKQANGLIPLALPPSRLLPRPAGATLELPTFCEQINQIHLAVVADNRSPAGEPPDGVAGEGGLPAGRVVSGNGATITGLLVVASPDRSLHHWSAALLAPLGRCQGAADGFSRFNILVEKGMLPLPASWDKGTLQSHFLRGAERVELHLTLPVVLPLSFWRISFFERVASGRFALTERELPLRAQAVQLDFPVALVPGTTVEGVVHLYTSSSHILRIEGSQSESRPVRPRSRITVSLTSASHLELSLLPNGSAEPAWRGQWSGDWPLLEEYRFHPLRAGESLSVQQGLLLPDLTAWGVMALERLLDYPLRCAEQASSIIAGLWMLHRLAQQGRPVRYGPGQLEGLLQQELTHLASLFTPSGRLSLWSGTEVEVEKSPPQSQALEWIVWQNLLPLKEGGPPAAHLLLDRLERLLLPLPPGSKPFGSELENLYFQALRQESMSRVLADRLRLQARDHLFRTPLGLFGRGSDLFKQGDYFTGIILDFLSAEGNPAMEYREPRARLNKRRSGFWHDLLVWLSLRAHPKEESLYGRIDDPIFALLTGLGQSSGFTGHWGTAATVRVVRALLRLVERRPFRGTFQLEGESQTMTPGKPMPVGPGRITLTAGEGIVAERVSRNLVDHVLAIDNRRYPDLSMELHFIGIRDQLKWGRSYSLVLSVRGAVLTNPQVYIFHSGLLEMNSLERDAQNMADGALVALPNRTRTIQMRAVRRGRGKILAWVTDMYDPLVEHRAELTLDVV